ILSLEYEHYRTLAIPLYVIGIVSLLYVHFFGVMEKGSQRWVTFAGIKLQPSEFMKIILIIMLATVIYRVTKKAKTRREKDLKILFNIGIIGVILLYLKIGRAHV